MFFLLDRDLAILQLRPFRHDPGVHHRELDECLPGYPNDVGHPVEAVVVQHDYFF
jgi:hypothetical protein